MWVLPIKAFIEMATGAPPSFQELMSKQLLRRWKPGLFCVFVSHEWTATESPDPTGKQFMALCAALKGIIDGSVSVFNEVLGVLCYKLNEQLSASDRARLADGFLWLDWMSVPQLTTCSPEQRTAELRENVRSAIRSIPAYVEACRLFLVLCPTLQHADDGRTCDKESWGKRGWCRVELAAATMARRQRCPVVVIQAAETVYFMAPGSSVSSRPGDGDFTVDGDRVVLYQIMEEIVDQCSLFNRKSKKDQTLATCLQAMRGHLLTGFGDEAQQQAARVAAEEDAEAFLHRFGFKSLLDVGSGGFGPAACAAVCGNLNVIQQLAASRANLDQGLTKPIPEVNHLKGATPLILAASLGQVEAVRCLLDCGASTAKKDSSGNPVLLYSRTAPVVELLLDRRCNVNEDGSLGNKAIHAVSIFGRAECLEVLLQNGAELEVRVDIGPTPLIVAAYFGRLSCARLLLESQADVSALARPHGSVGSAIVRAAELAWRCSRQRNSTALRFFATVRGSAALHVAALAGHVDLVQLLLDARAEPSLRNSAGYDALGMAALGGHYGVLDALKRRLSVSVVLPDAVRI